MLPHCLQAQSYVFAQLTGSPINTNGWNFQGGAKKGNLFFSDNSEIILCPVNASSGAVFYNQPINLSICSRWKAEFDFRMHDGSGADGLAFCFLDVPPSGFASGAGLGIPAAANGLKVGFDTWNNCSGNAGNVHFNMPKIEIRYGVGYDECAAMPTKDNSDNSISFIADEQYKHAKITYDNGNISVFVNDVLYITGYQQFSYTGYLGFTASTGGYNDNHSIKNVVIYTEMPPSEAGNGTTVCPNTPVQIGGANNPDYLYSWSPASGLSNAGVANPVVTIDNNGPVSANLKYYVKTSFKTNAGCASVDSVDIKILAKPKVNFVTPEICLSDALATFKDSSYTGEPALLPFNWQWSFGDSKASAANPNTATVANPSHTYSSAANYQVTLKVTNSAGCADSLKKIFTVNGATPKAVFNLLNTADFCSNRAISLQDASTVDFGKITKLVIDWGDGTVLLNDPLPFSGKIYSHLFPKQIVSEKVYTIRYTVYSGVSCVNQISKAITVQQSPELFFDTIPTLCITDAPFQLTQVSETNNLPGTWLYEGLGTSHGGLVDPKTGAGARRLTAIFTTQNGCSDSAFGWLMVYPNPSVNAGPDQYMLEGGNTFFEAAAAGQTALRWSPPAYLQDPTAIGTRASPPKTTQYVLTAFGFAHCFASDTVNVIVLKKPNIPGAFSPNGDGINDNWQIRYLDTYAGCTIDVFDRYGKPVYHSTGYSNPWNGTVNGAILPVGVYYYIINTKKHERPFTGSVTIVR